MEATVSYSRPGVIETSSKISTVKQWPGAPDIEIWHTRKAGREWLSIETETGDDPAVMPEHLPKLITELTRIEKYLGTGNYFG